MSLIKKEQTILLIIDIQDKLAVTMNQRAKVVSNTQKLIFTAEKLNIPVIVTEQYPKGLGKTVPEIIENLSKYEPIEKVAFSCCGEEKFINKISEYNLYETFRRKNIVISGMESHVCVQQTAIGLIDKGYNVYVVGDAVCSRRKEDWKFSLHRMRQAGVIVTTTESVILELVSLAGTSEFKDILSIIK